MNLKEKKSLKLSIVRSKTHVHTKYSPIVRYFGCLKCSFAGTTECPHNIGIGQHHGNYICSYRSKYLMDRLQQCGTIPRLFQQEELFKLTQISENMLKNYFEEGDLSEEFKHISKLIVSLTDKMRRQDEGIKIQGEITLSHEKFKDLVDAEAKKIEERNNRTRQGEFKEEIRDSGQKTGELAGLPQTRPDNVCI